MEKESDAAVYEGHEGNEVKRLLLLSKKEEMWDTDGGIFYDGHLEQKGLSVQDAGVRMDIVFGVKAQRLLLSLSGKGRAPPNG